MKKVDCRKFLTPGYTTSGHVELFTVCSYKYLYTIPPLKDMVRSQSRDLTLYLSSQVSVERGMSWEEATHAWADQNGPDDGFYVQV